MTKKYSHFANVVLPLPMPRLFTYAIPDELNGEVTAGKRAIVQFGAKKFYSALIWEIHMDEPKEYQVKEIISVLDSHPIVLPVQMKLWQWIAEYYMCTLGEVYKAGLPSGLKLESETKVFYNPEFSISENEISGNEMLILDALHAKNVLTIKELSKLKVTGNLIVLVNNLLKREAVFVSESIKESYKQKKEYLVSCYGDVDSEIYINSVYEELKRAPKQLELFLNYIKLLQENKRNKEESPITRKKLIELSGTSSSIFNSLVDKFIFKVQAVPISRLKSKEASQQAKNLSEAQNAALQSIIKNFEETDVQLLHGVTSSGKTELYIRLIQEQIDRGKQVLYLLPEIALTTQITNRLTAVFGDKVGIYHSKFSDAERVEVWNNVLQAYSPNSFQVVLGVRSSIFLPFSNLGLIIVDEEHETTYKQFDPAPRYNARDTSMVLAKMHGAKVLLGTATPSIETYANVKAKKYSLTELQERHKNIQLPAIEVVNLIDAKRKKQMHSLFTKHLMDEMEATLKNGEQIILFQNRRGFSPYLECNVCGHIPSCKFCDVSLTYHKFSNSLICHYCGYTLHNDGKCKACESPETETKGFGTEKVEDELKLILPEAKVARMDLDTTRSKFAHEVLIESFEKKEIDILVGTQMVTKGLDFENVSLVGILDADSMLNQPDFRSFERSYQLITQVSGRAGRSSKRGKVIIQTSSPKNTVIRDVLDNNFNNHYVQQMTERKDFRYPPFYRLLRLSVKHKDKVVADTASDLLAQSLRSIFGWRILGPEFPPVNRIQNQYIKNILLKIERDKSFAKAKELIQVKIDELKIQDRFKSVTVVANVDPY